MQVAGQRVTAPNGITIEEWICDDLQWPLIQKTSTSNGAASTLVTSLQLGDPSPVLFLPPGDYTVVDETGPFTVK